MIGPAGRVKELLASLGAAGNKGKDLGVGWRRRLADDQALEMD
jgi:hypothetical protein